MGKQTPHFHLFDDAPSFDGDVDMGLGQSGGGRASILDTGFSWTGNIFWNPWSTLLMILAVTWSHSMY